MMANNDDTLAITARAFFETLYQHCDDQGCLELRPLPSGRQVFLPWSKDDLEQRIASLSNENVFFGVATRKDSSSGKLKNCQELPALFVDIDFKDTSEDRARKLLNNFALPPSVVIQSGNGLHVYWLLKEPLVLDEPGAPEMAKDYLRRLVIALKGDFNAAEPARVLRVPGTLNYKYSPPCPVEVEVFDLTRIYDMPDFDDCLPEEDIPQSQHKECHGDGSIPEGQRNTTLTSLAGKMRRPGMDAGEIDAALQVINTRRCKPPLPETEVRAVAHSIAKCPAGPVPDSGSAAPPTRTEAPWPDPPDAMVYHGLAGEFVRLIEPHSEADPMALLLQFLAGVGSVIGRTAYFLAESTKHYLNLFLVIVGMTSKARKGSSWSHVKRGFEDCDGVWGSNCVKGGLSSGEGLIWAVRDAIFKTVPIMENKKHTGGYETICVDLGIDDKRLLVQEAEFSSVLRMTDREGNTLSSIIRKAWETGDLESLTKNSPAKATNAHISIVGHIVKDEVERYLSRTEVGNGFANRFLWVCAKRSKLLPEGGQLDEVNMAAFIVRLKQAIEIARGTGELKRDEGARDIWLKVYGKLSEGAPGLFGAVTSRAEAQVMRLACLYALLDGCSVIKAIHLTAALAVWDYCEASARHIWGDALGDPVADDILSALRGSPTGLTRTQISDLFGRNLNKDQIGRALATLLEHGRVRQESEKPEKNGRSVERWFAI